MRKSVHLMELQMSGQKVKRKSVLDIFDKTRHEAIIKVFGETVSTLEKLDRDKEILFVIKQLREFFSYDFALRRFGRWSDDGK